jgi:hypothetical protein
LEIPADKELEEDSPAGSSAIPSGGSAIFTQTAHGMIGAGWSGAKLLD